jgi:hypothetical protein
MSELVAVVTVTHGDSPAVDVERPVRTLQDLYDACRSAPPAALVRVTLQGKEGDVRLNFASYLHEK